MSTLRLDRLSITYRTGTTALQDFTLSMDPGECVAVVGESGCGKTSLVKALIGLLPATATISGRIEVAGNDLTGADQARWQQIRGSRIGYVAQDPYASCDPLRTVHHHVREGWRAKQLRPPEDEVSRRLTALGVASFRGTDHPHTWSGGMLQRATITAATALGPDLVLADEPTSALDTDLAGDVLRTLRKNSAALLLVSHDLSLVAEHADRVVVLHHGRVVETGATDDVLHRARHPRTRSLVESSRPRTPRVAPPQTGERSVPVVVVTKVSRTYAHGGSPVVAVRDRTIQVHPGEILGITGPSGCGKSTLLRLLAGIERPDRGTVTMAGQPVWSAGRHPSRPRPGYVMPIFQDATAGLDPRWPIWQTLVEPLRYQGNPPTRRQGRERARAELDRLRLTDVDLDAVPGQLSGGQCQRVAIGRALIAGPALVVADEPTAALDVTTASVIVDLLVQAAEAGAALVMVSHDRPRLAGFAHRILEIPHPETRDIQ